MNGFFITLISHDSIVPSLAAIHSVSQIVGVILYALQKIGVGTERGGDRIPFSVQIFLRGLFEGLTRPIRFPRVAGERGLHAKQIVSLHCQRCRPVAALQNSLGGGYGSQNMAFFHIPGGKFTDGFDEFGFCHGVFIQCTVAVEIILLIFNGDPLALIAGPFYTQFSRRAKIIFFLFYRVPAGIHFSFLTFIAAGLKVEIFAADLFPSCLQNSVLIEIERFLIDHLPSDEHFSVGPSCTGGGKIVGISIDGVPACEDFSTFSGSFLSGSVVGVVLFGDPTGFNNTVTTEIIPVFAYFDKAG